MIQNDFPVKISNQVEALPMLILQLTTHASQVLLMWTYMQGRFEKNLLSNSSMNQLVGEHTKYS